jgi:hypothetical protein
LAASPPNALRPVRPALARNHDQSRTAITSFVRSSWSAQSDTAFVLARVSH